MLIPSIEKVKLSELNFASYNPRIMPDNEMEALKASMRKYGCVLSLVVQKKGMIVIGGHQRITAINEICKEDNVKVPTHVYASVLDITDDEAKILNIGLNKISGVFDDVKLSQLLTDIGSDIDIVPSGFSKNEIDNILKFTAIEAPTQQEVSIESFALPTLQLGFDTEEKQQELAEIINKNRKPKEPTGLTVLRLLTEKGKRK
jgi:ParB-like chromosome segregation protein Spo0J